MGTIIDVLSEKITNLIRKHRIELAGVTKIDITEEKLEVIEYGLYNFFSDVIKMVALLIIAAILGIFRYSVIGLISFGLFRSWAGGVHAKKSHLACFSSNLIINFTSVYLSMLLVKINPNTLSGIKFTLFVICLLGITLYAPADVQEKPISSIKKKKLFLMLSYLVLTVYYITSVALGNNIIGNILMLSAIGEVITILPITYKLTNNKLGDINQFLSEQ